VFAREWIAHDLWRGDDHTESTECIVQELLVHIRLQIAHENVSTDIKIALVLRGFVYANGLAKQLNHVHYLHCVLRVFWRAELDKAKVLFRAGHFIFRHEHVDNGARLEKQLPEELFSYLGLQISYITGSLLVSVHDGPTDGSHPLLLFCSFSVASRGGRHKPNARLAGLEVTRGGNRYSGAALLKKREAQTIGGEKKEG